MKINEYPKKQTLSDTDEFVLEDPVSGTRAVNFKNFKDSIGSAGTFIGTTEEVNQAIQNGQIKEGMIVNITDD